jgi:hypothetical protein
MSVVVKRDVERGEIVARLQQAPDDGPLQARGRFKVQVIDRRVVAVAVVDDGSWSNTILADLIAQQLGIHRDDAIQAVLEANLTR